MYSACADGNIARPGNVIEKMLKKLKLLEKTHQHERVKFENDKGKQKESRRQAIVQRLQGRK